MNNDDKITNKELELIDYVRLVFNEEFNTNFTATGARKIYELIKILINKKSNEIVCSECPKKYKIHETKQ